MKLFLSFFFLTFINLIFSTEPKVGLIGHHISASSDGKTFLVTGGLYRENSSLLFSKGTYLRDYRSSVWEKQPDGISPGPRTNSASVYFSFPAVDSQEEEQEYFYIFGGENWNGVLSDQYLYHINTRTWKRLPSPSSSAATSFSTSSLSQSLPLKRSGHSLAWDRESKKIFMFGGKYISNSRISFYDPSNLDPSQINQPLPTWTKDREYAGFSDLWEFSPLQNKWTILWKGSNSMTRPLAREESTIFSLEETIFLYGGVDPRSGFRFNDFWIFYMKQWKQLGAIEDKSTKFNPFYPPPLTHALLIPNYLTVTLSNGIKKNILSGGILYGGLTGGLNDHLTCGQAYKFSFPSIISHYSNSNLLLNEDDTIEYFSLIALKDNTQWSSYKLDFIKSYGLESHLFLEYSNQIIEFGGLKLKNISNLFDIEAHIDVQFEEFLPQSLSLPPLDYFYSSDLCTEVVSDSCHSPFSLTSIYSTPLSLSVWGARDKHEIFSSLRRIQVTKDYAYLINDDLL